MEHTFWFFEETLERGFFQPSLTIFMGTTKKMKKTEEFPSINVYI